MDRRSAVRRLGAGRVALLSGCASGLSPDDSDDRERTATDRRTVTTERSLASLGVPSDVCGELIRPDPGIDAITAPAFAADWSSRDIDSAYRRGDRSGLADDRTVVGVEASGRTRAYPLSVLADHEVVNDEFGGPLLVTYCPLCASGPVADRTVGGRATAFGVTGLLWQPPREYAAASEADGAVFGADRYGGESDRRHNGDLLMYDEATRSYWS